jgi:hypothetical protein
MAVWGATAYSKLLAASSTAPNFNTLKLMPPVFVFDLALQDVCICGRAEGTGTATDCLIQNVYNIV